MLQGLKQGETVCGRVVYVFQVETVVKQGEVKLCKIIQDEPRMKQCAEGCICILGYCFKVQTVMKQCLNCVK